MVVVTGVVVTVDDAVVVDATVVDVTAVDDGMVSAEAEEHAASVTAAAPTMPIHDLLSDERTEPPT